ncbi:hypothetical protein QTP70_024936 [Hemibagrus guttatus]|uniref:Uncharacterized protein n=1 Tax=Hemibagrus guttatus TaxID=175788 RepID=A0AAE0QTM4_9TELE|nr:hypothetical protein QTP70_024936 [Hemibagrus guttatus]
MCEQQFLLRRTRVYILILVSSASFQQESRWPVIYGLDGQYALGINVPARYCAEDDSLDQNFLSQDEANIVKRDMSSSECIYVGNELVGARPKRKNSKINIHSESLLLRISDPSPMQNLLNKRKDGCTVFYTYNSPCVQSCSTPNKPYSIIPALEMFNRHQGPKAFVFSQIFKHDVGKAQWEENIREIEKRIPVYRCNNTACFRCIKDDQVVSECKVNEEV